MKMKEYDHMTEHFTWAYVRGMTVTRSGAFSGSLSVTFEGRDTMVMYPQRVNRVMMPARWRDTWVKACRKEAVPVPTGFGGVLQRGWMNSGPCWGNMVVPPGVVVNTVMAFDWARQGASRPEGWGAEPGSCMVIRGDMLQALEQQLEWLSKQELAVEAAPYLPMVQPDGKCVHITANGLMDAEPCNTMAPGRRWPGVNEYGAFDLYPPNPTTKTYMHRLTSWLWWWLPDTYLMRVPSYPMVGVCVPFEEAFEAALSMTVPQEGETAKDFYIVRRDGSLRSGGEVIRYDTYGQGRMDGLYRLIRIGPSKYKLLLATTGTGSPSILLERE